MNLIASVCDDRDVQTRADESKDQHAALTVILAGVLAKQTLSQSISATNSNERPRLTMLAAFFIGSYVSRI